ncbi:uncharacterized protein BXZ73DRAFT_83263 [Epithele typhae]|uniref:uncharacterized protein n=1 Tax=Epithele typhae TaxID=378194 RepID=UPI002007CD3A|nr:uncharacterized protein BXZ73DRAFT_83263 [Epithele typhae]KAH9910712.1 hypothetical protein BXZ73DRAFT_83263 [Epithele typhae]
MRLTSALSVLLDSVLCAATECAATLPEPRSFATGISYDGFHNVLLSATAAPAAKAANAAMSAAVASAAVAFATAVHPNQDFALSAATSAARPSAATAAVCPSAAVAAFAVVAARSAAAVGPMHSAAASGAVVEHASAAVVSPNGEVDA